MMMTKYLSQKRYWQKPIQYSWIHCKCCFQFLRCYVTENWIQFSSTFSLSYILQIATAASQLYLARVWSCHVQGSWAPATGRLQFWWAVILSKSVTWIISSHCWKFSLGVCDLQLYPFQTQVKRRAHYFHFIPASCHLTNHFLQFAEKVTALTCFVISTTECPSDLAYWITLESLSPNQFKGKNVKGKKMCLYMF